MAGLNLFTNNAATTLASSITNVDTSLTVATSTGSLFPTLTGSEYFFCTLANTAGTVEIIKVTARSGDTFSTIVRGQDGTSAVSWSAGDKVELRLTRIDLLNFPQLDSTNTFALAQTFTAAPVFTNQSGTRSAMSAAASGANSDITSLTACTTITGLTTPLSVAQGGTGATTLGSGDVLIGAGTGAVTSVAAGTTGNVLTSNGTTWTSAAAAGGQFKTELFATPGPATWTNPGSVTSVRVTVIGGGGGGGGPDGGFGGAGMAIVPVTGPVNVTVGAGGAAAVAPSIIGSPGSTSSFGSAISSTGGVGGSPTAVPGTCTVSSGTAIKTMPTAVGPTITTNDPMLGWSFGGLFFWGHRQAAPSSIPALVYSASSIYGAGSRGSGSPTASSRVGGIGGAVLVEFVG